MRITGLDRGPGVCAYNGSGLYSHSDIVRMGGGMGITNICLYLGKRVLCISRDGGKIGSGRSGMRISKIDPALTTKQLRIDKHLH